jgi:hypothetical protein
MRILKLAGACLLIGASYAAVAAVQKYDGKYKGTIVHVSGVAGGRTGVACGFNEPQERMTVIAGGNLTFVFNKSMTLTGPVQEDGSFVAAGTIPTKTSVARFELTGKIENGALNADLSSQLKECVYKVEQKKS